MQPAESADPITAPGPQKLRECVGKHLACEDVVEVCPDGNDVRRKCGTCAVARPRKCDALIAHNT